MIYTEHLKKGIIIKVLELDEKTPKSQHRWMRQISYDPNWIQPGFPAYLYYKDNGKDRVTITSHIKAVQEDFNNLTIWTQNSVYYIKKFN